MCTISNKLYTILLLGFGLTGLHAQETTSASGGDASGSGGSVSYSIGQVMYITNMGINNSEAQGIQQSYEFSVLAESSNSNSGYTVTPNPTTDFVILKIISYEDLYYQLYNVLGQIIIENQKITGSETHISMETLAPATYFLKIYSLKPKVIYNQKEAKIIKYIKIVKIK
jgi:hypothetical protein